MYSSTTTVDGSTTQVIPSNNAVEMEQNQHISKKIGKFSFKAKIMNLKPKTWPKKSGLFIRSHWKFFLTPLIIIAMLTPAMSYLSNGSPPITIDYLSPSILEYGDENNSLDWEITGLDGFSIGYTLYLDESEIKSGKIEKNSFSYPINDLNLSLGDYDFKLELKNSKVDVINLVSLLIDNYAPGIDCSQEKGIFESNSPEKIEFLINDMSVNGSYYELSLIDRYENVIIKNLSSNFNPSDNLVFPISDFEPGFYKIDLTIYDGMGLNTNIVKEFSVFENLAPRINPSFGKEIDVEVGEIFSGHFDVSDYNTFENGTYLLTLDEDNINPLSTGIWNGGDYYEFSVDTEDLSLGYHSVSLVIEDKLGETSLSSIDFDLKYTKNPEVSIDSSLIFNSDYNNPNIFFTVSDYELYNNATYQFNINKRIISGNLIQFAPPQYIINPHYEKLDVDYVLESSVEYVPNSVQCEFEIQKYLRLGQNEVNLVITDGKGGSTLTTFIITLEELVIVPQPSFNLISYLIDHPFIFLILCYLAMMCCKGVISLGKNIKNENGLILFLVFSHKKSSIKRDQRKEKKELMLELKKKINELKKITGTERKKKIKIIDCKIKEEKNFSKLNSILKSRLTKKKHDQEFFILSSTLISELTIEQKREKLYEDLNNTQKDQENLLYEEIAEIITRLEKFEDEKDCIRNNLLANFQCEYSFNHGPKSIKRKYREAINNRHQYNAKYFPVIEFTWEGIISLFKWCIKWLKDLLSNIGLVFKIIFWKIKKDSTSLRTRTHFRKYHIPIWIKDFANIIWFTIRIRLWNSIKFWNYRKNHALKHNRSIFKYKNKRNTKVKTNSPLEKLRHRRKNNSDKTEVMNPTQIRSKAKRLTRVFLLLFLNLGIVSMLTNAQGAGGDYPVTGFDINPTFNIETNTTGWDTNQTLLKIRLFDHLSINWTSTQTAYNVVQIKNASSGEEIYEERMWLAAGSHSHAVYMDPERHFYKNFLPDQNYTIQIRLEVENTGILDTIGYSDVLTFRVIKAKAQIEFFPPEYSDSTTPTGIYVVSHVSDPVDPHYEFFYQCRIVDANRPEVALQGKEIRLFFYNTTTHEYDFVNMADSTIDGKYEFSEKRYDLLQIPTALFESLEDDYYYHEYQSSMLSGDNIFSPFDYTGPNTLTEEISDGSEPVEPYIVSTITELQRSYTWNTPGDFNGFLLNDTQGAYHQFDVSNTLECLYLGTITGNNLTATILSPAIYYYGQQIAEANLSTTFNTIYDKNNYSDPLFDGDIFDVDLLLYNEDGVVIDEWALFDGDFEGYQTKSYSLSPNLFTKPTAFRIGYRVSIRVNESTFSFDSVDEMYFSLKNVNFHVIYSGPQYGNAGHLNGDWAGYSYEGRTKQMEVAFDTNSFTTFVRSGLSTPSSFPTISSTGEVILDSAIDFTHVDLQGTDVSLNLNTEIQKIVYGTDGEIDGSYSIYLIPILANGTRLDNIYVNSDSITSTQSLDSISLNMTSYLGQDIEKFAFKNWMSVDSQAIGAPDLYNIHFENVNISVDGTDTFDLIDVETPPTPPSYYVSRTLETLPDQITLYDPDYEGFVVDKLVAGSFPEGTTVWDDFVTINGSHVNASYYYSDGDNVIAEDVPIYGSDESETWSYLHTSNNYINFESILTAEDFCSTYTFAWIYFPRLETDVFLKLGSDDGSRIWFDGIEVNYAHVIRTLATQNSEQEHDIVEIGPTSAGWHRVMTMTENKDKKYKMRYRISTTGGTGDDNFTPIQGLKVAVESPDYDPRFNPISMDSIPTKESKSDANRNSLVLAISEQRVGSQSESELMSLSPVTDASGLTSTLFTGTLNMQILGFVDNWDSTSTSVDSELYFKLFVRDGSNFVEEYSTMIWNSELSDLTMFNLDVTDIEIDLGQVFCNYSGTEDPDLSDYQIRLVASFETDANGWTPECGIEIIKSSLVLRDDPPTGMWQGIGEGSFLTGITPISIFSNTHDTVAVRFLGSNDGISWATIGETQTHDVNWVFSYDFDTENSDYSDDDTFYLMAELRDEYSISNVSIISVAIDNVAPQVDFLGSFYNNMTLNQPINLTVSSYATDIEYISFQAKTFNSTWDAQNIIYLSNATNSAERSGIYGTYYDYWFTFNPWMIDVGTYDFRAVAYDRTYILNGTDYLEDILVSRFNPVFYDPSPTNQTGLVRDIFFFNFSSNAQNFDNITVSTADLPTTVLSETTFTEHTTLDYNSSDIYYLGVNTSSVFGMVEGMYFIQFDFNIGSYTETYYYLIFVDNISPDAGAISMPDAIFEDFYDPFISDTFPRMNTSTIQLNMSSYTNCDDLVSLEYFAEIYSKNNSEFSYVPLRRFTWFDETYFDQIFDLSDFSDGEIVFGAIIIDRVGHSFTTKTQKFFLDKNTPEIFLPYPAISQQILINPDTENTLNFVVNFNDNDIKNISLYGEIVGNDNITDDLNFTEYMNYPNDIVNFSIYLDQSQSYKFFRQYIENPVLEWEITVFDYFGQKTIKSQQFICVEILDLDAPVINSIETPSIFSEWTGGFDVVLNTSDYDSNVIMDTDDWTDSSGTGCSVIDNETYLTEQYNFKFDDQSVSEICLIEREYFNLTSGYYSFRIATTDSDKEFNMKLLEDMNTRINLRLYLGELQSYNGTHWNFVSNITENIFYFVQIAWYNTDNSTYSIRVDDLYVGDFVLESEITSHINFVSLSTGITDSGYQVYVNRLHFDNIEIENELNNCNPSEIRYIAVYVDQDPSQIPSQQNLFTPLVNSYYGETDLALGNFLGYVTEINVSDGLYYFNPWQIGEKFNKLTEGEHDFLIVVYDNNYNFAYTEFIAYIIVPELSIDSDTLMATSSTDKNLTLELIDYGDQVVSVEFQIYDALTFTTASIPIDSMIVYNATNVTYSVTFSNILEKEYYLNYIITQTDGSIIERFHYCYLPEGVLTTLGYPDNYWYDEYNFTISEGIPHDITLSVQDGDIISGFFDLEVYWLGNGTVDQINLYLDDVWQYNIDDFIMIDNNSAHGLIPSDFIPDGQYYLSVKVNFTNGQEGWSDPSVIIDNSPPEWISSGLWINGISQFSLIDRTDGFVHIYTNDDLIINITAQDPHTNLTTMNCWLENSSGAIVWSNNFVNGEEQSLDLDLITSLSSFDDGMYYFFFNLTSEGGIISIQPICVHLTTFLPEGTFSTPDSSTIFGGDVITLEFEPTNQPTPITSVEFFIQTDNTPISNYNMTINLNNVQDDLEFLGLSHIRYNPYIQDYVYRLDYHQTNDLLIGSDRTFWAKLVDLAGNIQYIKTLDTHDINRYYFEIDDFEDVYYLEDGVNVTGTFNHYDSEIPTGVDLSVKNGSTYISLNTDATYVNLDGTFEVNWTSNNLPLGLENAKIPISYLHFDNGEYFAISAQNFAMYGNFMSTDSEIAFITLDNIRTMHIFKHEPDTIYNWTRYDYTGSYSQDEAIEAYAWDLDGDDLDEIILITESSIIILDYNGVSFVKTEYTFDNLESQFPIDLTSTLKFTHSPSNLIIANEFEIYSLFYNSTTPGFEYVTTISLPEQINDLTYGTINNQDTLITVSNNEVLYYDYLQEIWISIFKTRYSLVNKVVVDNVDLDPESEILFGVYGYNGVDVVRADFNQTLNQWRLMCAISYSDISTIYDLGSGHLMNNNYGYAVVASDLGIDMALIPYTEIEIEIGADASHNMEDYYEQNGLYEYNELSEEAANWDDQIGELHYRSEGVSSETGKFPTSLDCPYSVTNHGYGIRPTNYLDYDLNTLSESDSYSLIIENYEKRGDYTGYGDAIFSMGTDFLTDTKYLITFDFSLHFSGDVVNWE
jgi:hypothetical protein